MPIVLQYSKGVGWFWVKAPCGYEWFTFGYPKYIQYKSTGMWTNLRFHHLHWILVSILIMDIQGNLNWDCGTSGRKQQGHFHQMRSSEVMTLFVGYQGSDSTVTHVWSKLRTDKAYGTWSWITFASTTSSLQRIQSRCLCRWRLKCVYNFFLVS